MTPGEQRLLAQLKMYFHEEFQPVQQELAALVAELRAYNLSTMQIGGALARVERDLRELRAFVMGIPLEEPKPKPKPPAKLLKLVERDEKEP